MSKSVANPLAEKVQNIKDPNCRNTSNTNNLIYILKTKNLFLQAVGLVPKEWLILVNAFFSIFLSPGNFAVEVNGGQPWCCRPDGFFSVSQKRETGLHWSIHNAAPSPATGNNNLICELCGSKACAVKLRGGSDVKWPFCRGEALLKQAARADVTKDCPGPAAGRALPRTAQAKPLLGASFGTSRWEGGGCWDLLVKGRGRCHFQEEDDNSGVRGTCVPVLYVGKLRQAQVNQRKKADSRGDGCQGTVQIVKSVFC